MRREPAKPEFRRAETRNHLIQADRERWHLEDPVASARGVGVFCSSGQVHVGAPAG
jgi:hypothetical protein